MLALPLPLRVYSIANFILFATLLTSLLAAFIPLHGTTFDSGLDGLGKVDSHLKYFRIRQFSYLCVLRIKCHMVQFCSKFSYNLWTKAFKDKIFEKSKKPQNPRKFEPSKFSGYTVFGSVDFAWTVSYKVTKPTEFGNIHCKENFMKVFVNS